VTPLRFIQITTAVDKNIFNGKGKSKGERGGTALPTSNFHLSVCIVGPAEFKGYAFIAC